MTDTYVIALHVDDIFADPTYQRVHDVRRARHMAHTWDAKLCGVIEVSDRGAEQQPRYAVVDGQHRWEAAKCLRPSPALVANVHEGLTVEDEAALFDKLNRQRKQTNTWDHWKARRAAGDEQVRAIENTIHEHGLAVDMSPSDGCVACVSALEKVVKLGGTALLSNALELICKAWGDRRDGFDSSIIRGVSMVLHYLDADIDSARLFDALQDVLPRQLKAQANTIREITPGTAPVATAIAIMSFYNKRPGRRTEVSNKTFGGSGVVNNTRSRAAAPRRQPSAQPAPLKTVMHQTEQKRTVPDALPPEHSDTTTYGDAVVRMDGQPITEVAQAIGIPERTVRRIRIDLGLDVAAS